MEHSSHNVSSTRGSIKDPRRQHSLLRGRLLIRLFTITSNPITLRYD
nr:MAG TPA: hypothetical protein [Caudoviricetes sp.]